MNGGPIGETRGKNKQHNDNKSNTNKQTKEKTHIKVHIKSAYEPSGQDAGPLQATPPQFTGVDPGFFFRRGCTTKKWHN